jgi:hypothetical protein
MSYRRANLYAFACCACLIIAAILASQAAAAPHCHEDDPCFAWSTMGNLHRGVILKPGKTRAACVRMNGRYCVVDPCGFAWLDHSGRIDWSRTPRLRGDHTARRHGCNPALFG